jgi:SAM-dependent methyltransferase
VSEAERTRASYDAVSGVYADRFSSELDHKPFDRFVLDRFADHVRGHGPVADVGCGPGQIAHYLTLRGVDARGGDLSPGMIEQACAAHPEIPFAVGDMRNLDVADDTWAGISAFYSIIHIARHEISDVLRELLRVLVPGGHLLLTFHIGDETVHLDDWFEQKVDIDFHFFERAEMETHLCDTGFEILAEHEREPYPDVEADTRRAYFLATKPRSAHRPK